MSDDQDNQDNQDELYPEPLKLLHYPYLETQVQTRQLGIVAESAEQAHLLACTREKAQLTHLVSLDGIIEETIPTYTRPTIQICSNWERFDAKTALAQLIPGSNGKLASQAYKPKLSRYLYLETQVQTRELEVLAESAEQARELISARELTQQTHCRELPGPLDKITLELYRPMVHITSGWILCDAKSQGAK